VRSGSVLRNPLTRCTGWLLITALLSVVSLQLVAADHWHGVEDTEHCAACLTGVDAPHTTSPAVVLVPRHSSLDLPPVVVAATDSFTPYPGNRDPPAPQN